MVTTKSFVASALLALFFAGAALADNPTIKLNAEDQGLATQALVRTGDFGLGWRGGMVKPTKLTGASCPGFDPKESDLVITGHASASFQNARARVQVAIDTQVLGTAAAVLTDFGRTIQPQLPGCLAYQLKQGTGIVTVTVDALHFPKLGAVSAAYRATATIRAKGRTDKVISDYVFVGNGRLEYTLNVQAPAHYRAQLVPFEADVVRMLIRRGTSSTA